MNWLVKWGVKKWVIGIVNTALDNYRESVVKARYTVGRYIGKAEALLSFLKSVDAKLADGKVTNEEADRLVEEATATAKALCA